MGEEEWNKQKHIESLAALHLVKDLKPLFTFHLSVHVHNIEVCISIFYYQNLTLIVPHLFILYVKFPSVNTNAARTCVLLALS